MLVDFITTTSIQLNSRVAIARGDTCDSERSADSKRENGKL